MSAHLQVLELSKLHLRRASPEVHGEGASRYANMGNLEEPILIKTGGYHQQAVPNSTVLILIDGTVPNTTYYKPPFR